MTKQKVLFWDLETFSAEFLWDMPPREFVRLFQYAWGRYGDVHTTTDFDEMLDVVRSADLIIGQNILQFDTIALFGKDSTEPLELALENKVLDTMVWANLVKPAPYSFTTRDGHTYYDAAKPEKARKWLSLDNLAFQFGVEGKIGDLKRLAKEHALDPENPEHVAQAMDEYNVTDPADLPKWAFDGFGRIPLDNEEFDIYAKQDIVVLQQIATNLLELSGNRISEYTWREMLNAAIDAQNSKNGILVDVEAAQARVDELAKERDEIMDWLVSEFDFPTRGKQPWKSNDGKVAILKALESFGITPDNVEWPRTASGAPSFGGEVMLSVTAETPAERFGQALATLLGQRSLAQLALESVHSDGRAHPDITSLQRSGRKSTTKPGLSVWSARGDKAIEKRYFIASPGCKFVEMDFSQADARAVAALSGDLEYAKRFEPGADAHEITGRLLFGDKEYDSDPYTYRQIAKACNHAGAYGVGAKKLAAVTGLDISVTAKYIEMMKNTYPEVHKWKQRSSNQGETGWITNSWGRRMRVEPDRSYTMSSALLGQSTTNEMLRDGLIRIVQTDLRLARTFVAFIHDAVLFDIKEEDLDWAIPTIKSCMEGWFRPDGGEPVFFSVGVGEPADNWYTASH